MTDAAGAVTSFAYNQGTTTKTDPLGRVTQYVYDSGFRLLSITDALEGVTRYTYDSENRRTTETDANGFRTEFGYDSRGNRTTIRNPLGHTIHLFHGRCRTRYAIRVRCKREPDQADYCGGNDAVWLWSAR
jgi:YD repeat-containing protein